MVSIWQTFNRAAVMCQILQLEDQSSDHLSSSMQFQYVTLGGELTFNQPANYTDRAECWRFAQANKLPVGTTK